MAAKRLIRGANYILLSEDTNSFIVEQKLNLYYFLLFGIIAFAFKKNEKNRTISNIDQIREIRYKSSFMTGNIITLQFPKTTYLLEMNSKAALEDCLIFLRTTKLSSLIID